MTAPLKWRSQLCPCGYCPDGTRIEWRYSIDIRFRPRKKVFPTFVKVTTEPVTMTGPDAWTKEAWEAEVERRKGLP